MAQYDRQVGRSFAFFKEFLPISASLHALQMLTSACLSRVHYEAQASIVSLLNDAPNAHTLPEAHNCHDVH